MDRPTSRSDAADARNAKLAPAEAFVLPSRRPVLDHCRNLLGHGPILLTGDAGAGKTWLWNRLEREAGSSSRWLEVDLTPSNTSGDFYRLIGHELGLGGARANRVEIADFLADRLTDDDRWTLVIEEAHNLSLEVWEEVRVLANRVDRAGGFAGLVLVGQTALARQFSTWAFASIEARLAARVHLPPIDADEALELLQRVDPTRPWSSEEAEWIHRDARGNPRRILRRITSRGPVARVRPSITTSPIERHYSAEAEPEPLIGPVKPPLMVEENLIEVGWSPDDPASFDESDGVSLLPSDVPVDLGEEAILDHYAALQAWREFSENQARRTHPVATEPAPPSGEDHLEEDPTEALEAPSPLANRPTLWADGQQGFAPFGHLFTRMAQAQDPE